MQGQSPEQVLSALVMQSKSSVFFGGAGVSTASGIPDFRSKSGLYAAERVYGYAPEALLSHTMFAREPELFFRYYRENLIAPGAKPNTAHDALALLESLGLLQCVITQNIDGLHSVAGSKNVLELHGSNWRQYCVDCGKGYPLDYILSNANCIGHIPRCGICCGIVRPDVTLYEEPLDETVMSAAVTAITKADLLIVGGTSLSVYPAAGLLDYFSGDGLVIINKTKTPGDGRAKLVIYDAIDKVLRETMKYVDKM